MPRRARLAVEGIPWHIIQRGNNRTARFYCADDYHRYLKYLAEQAAKYGCDIHAYCLMTNHVHLLIMPMRQDGAGLMMKHLEQRYGVKIAGGQGSLKGKIVRIGHLGYYDATDMFTVISAFEATLNDLGLVKSFGAGVAAMQKLVPLPDGYGLWLTHERYMTVDGKDPIHGRGLMPAVLIQNAVPGFDELPPATDAPLAKAIERLKAKR